MTEQELRPCPFCGDDAILEPDGRFQCINNDCVLYLQEFRDYERPSWNTRPIEEALRSGTDKLMFELAVWQQDYNKLIDDFKALHAIALEVSSQLVYGSFINPRYITKLAAQFNGLLKEHSKEYGLPLSSTYDANYPDKETPNEQD